MSWRLYGGSKDPRSQQEFDFHHFHRIPGVKPDMERPARNAARLALDPVDTGSNTGSSSVVWFETYRRLSMAFGKGGTLDEHWMNMDEHILSSVKETTSSMQYLKYESFNRTLRSTYQAFFCDRFNHFRSIASPFDSFYCVPSRTACPASTQTFGSKLGQLGPSTHPLCKLWSFWCKGPQPSSANLRIGELTQNLSPSIAWASPRRLIMWSIFQRNAKRRVNQVN